MIYIIFYTYITHKVRGRCFLLQFHEHNFSNIKEGDYLGNWRRRFDKILRFVSKWDSRTFFIFLKLDFHTSFLVYLYKQMGGIVESEKTHKEIHRQKVLEKRELQRQKRKERHQQIGKRFENDEHRVNYYLLKQMNEKNTDKDKGIEKYYKEKYRRNRKKETKKKRNASKCLGCTHNRNGFCTRYQNWCSTLNQSCKN